WDQAGEPARAAVSRSLPSCPRAEEKTQPVWNLYRSYLSGGLPASGDLLPSPSPVAHRQPLLAGRAANLQRRAPLVNSRAAPLLRSPGPPKHLPRSTSGSLPQPAPTREEGEYGGGTRMSIGRPPGRRACRRGE